MITHPVLTTLAQHGVKLGIDRMKRFMQTLGEPHLAYPVVHIGGTNGKGSVSAMVTAILTAAGYRVGTNLSPHLENVNERIQFNGVPIVDQSLVDVIETVDRARLDFAQSSFDREAPLTYFEFVTAAAFLAFAQRQVDVAVVEVGLGGRLDATNIVQPAVTAVTHVGLDHQAQLGDSVTAIAREKAGIFKPGVPAIVGPMDPLARDELVRVARLRNAPVWKAGRDLRREYRRGQWNLAVPGTVLTGVTLGLEGEHQGANASVAMAIVVALRKQGFLITDEHIREGLLNAFIPGRIETLLPGLTIDGAHNPDSTAALARWLDSRDRPETRFLLFGMGQTGRDPCEVVAPLLPHFDEIITTRCAHPKAWDPVDLALQMQDLDAVLSAGGTVEETLPEIYREAHETVVAGSLFVAGAARAVVNAGMLAGIEPGQGLEEPLPELEMGEVDP